MPVPNIFANVTTSIPLSQLDANFATAIVLGNTSVYLGNTTTTLANVTIANANVTTALLLTGASGTSGQALTSGGANTAPTWTTIAASAATPTALGTVYGKTDNSGLTFLGYNAGNASSSGTNNTVAGVSAGLALTTGSSNTFFGHLAGTAMTTGATNVFIGKNAGKTYTTGNYNVGVGLQALEAADGDGVSTGLENTAIGPYALYLLTNGRSNTGLGYNAIGSVTTGIGNVGLGFNTGSALTTGSYNIYIGYQTGNATKTSGVDCIYIGRTITPGNATVNGELVINTNGNNQTGKGDGTGLIATGGNIFQQNNSASWATTSDRRLKKNIVDNNEGLNKLTQIQVRNFEYRTEEEITEIPLNQVIKKSGVQLGVIAQELQAILPECVKEESTGVLTVDSDNLTWYLINAVKELKAQLDALKAKVA